MEKVCKRCGTAVPQRTKFCRNCRSQEFVQPQRCSHCDAIIPKADINFCPTCGKRLSEKSVSRQWMVVAPEADPQVCGICRLPIETDLVFCPGCAHGFHFNHLGSWIVDKQNCPICKTSLELRETQ